MAPVTFNTPAEIQPAKTAPKAYCVGIIINLPLPSEGGGGDVTYKYKAVDSNGKFVPGSEREITETVAIALTDPDGPTVYAALKARAYTKQPYGAGTVS